LHEYFPAIAVSGTAWPVGSRSPPGFGTHDAGRHTMAQGDMRIEDGGGVNL
jgi:hypothetical protein